MFKIKINIINRTSLIFFLTSENGLELLQFYLVFSIPSSIKAAI